MPINVTMPRLSDTMEQGTVVKWNVKPGDKVTAGQVIADIETDKATMELQSFDAGTVASIASPEGKAVPVGTTIMVIAKDGEDASAAANATQDAPKAEPKAAPAKGDGAQQAARPANQGPTKADTEPARSPGRARDHQSNGHAEPQGGERVFASPLARKIAAETGVDLSQVSGSGPGGRIVRKDVEAVGSTPAARGGRARERQHADQPAQAAPRPLPSVGATLEARVIPLSSMRATIARRLVESKTTVPHYQVTVDVDMDALMDLRQQLNDQLAGLSGAGGVKLSVNDFLVRACALAMHEHPFVNSRWLDRGPEKDGGPAIEIMGQINIGIAIALPMERGGGLLVGTIRGADQLGLRHISAESRRLAAKAREKGLSIEEMSDSTFTISNLGMFGVSHFTAIINPPNVAILAVGAAAERPVVRDGQIAVGQVMSMTMSSDHRVVDGAMAAAYLQTVKGLLERPAALLV
jgi:pyruvate dehydrogenase E2 component (dihydrolipoamide acetyltransferase)